MPRPRTYAELDLAHDGPIPPHLIAPRPLLLTERIADQEKIVACRRQLALAALAERRRVRLANYRWPGIFEIADHGARRETRAWREARAALAQLRARLATAVAEAAE
jgi:hypothetical protein